MSNLLYKLNTYIDEDENYELNESFRKTLNELNELEPIDESEKICYNGGLVNEEAISVTLIISLILGAPSIIKSISKAFSYVFNTIKKLFKKEEKDKETFSEKIVKMADKWHHAYIVTLRQILRMGGIFKSAGITDKERQEKATEVVFYTIVFGFAILGGVATSKSIIHVAKHMSLSNISLASLEGVLTSIKSSEVIKFVRTVRS